MIMPPTIGAAIRCITSEPAFRTLLFRRSDTGCRVPSARRLLPCHLGAVEAPTTGIEHT